MSSSIEVHADPVPQPRPRATVTAGRARIYNPATAKPFKQKIMNMFIQNKDYYPQGIAVRVRIDYYFKRPASLKRAGDPSDPIAHAKKPDIDNLNKAVLDALSEAGIWHDDRQVADLHARKFYSGKQGTPMVIITIEEVRET